MQIYFTDFFDHIYYWYQKSDHVCTLYTTRIPEIHNRT